MKIMYKIEIKFDSHNLTSDDMDRICEQTENQEEEYILTKGASRITVDSGLLFLN